MGLFRMAVVVAVGVSLLPADRDRQDHLYERAASATSWALTFCERNPQTCEQGSYLWSQFVIKAEFGAKLAYDMMKESPLLRGDDGGNTDVAPVKFERSSDTLTAHDLKPAWRGRTATKALEKTARRGSI